MCPCHESLLLKKICHHLYSPQGSGKPCVSEATSVPVVEWIQRIRTVQTVEICRDLNPSSTLFSPRVMKLDLRGPSIIVSSSKPWTEASLLSHTPNARGPSLPSDREVRW